jgi:FKBP-type peptidyl-prolyl cis-trans isomerase FkpA
LASLSINLFAQVKKPVKSVKPVTKPVIAQPALNNLSDSAGYALGVDVATSLLAQNMTKINRPLITKGLNEVLDGKPSLIDENECFMVLSNYSTRMKEEKEKKSTAKPVAKPATKTVTPSKALMKTLADSAGYALGVNIATSLNYQDMAGINRALISRSLNDVMNGKPSLIPKEACVPILNRYAAVVSREKAIAVISTGEAFLEKNKLRPEIKTTASGLQYEVIKEGTGIRPTAVDTFVAHYRGTLIDGTEFESSYEHQPITYPLRGVVPGWTEGLQLMTVGSKYKFYIPYMLGYGARGMPPTIPGGAVLIFELDLLDVKKHKE